MAKIGNAPPFNLVPESLKPYFASALAIAVIAALLTNALYTLGVTRRATLVFEPSITPLERLALVRKILDDWKVAQNVKARATLTLRELFDENASSIRLRFNGCTLDFDLTRNAADVPKHQSPGEGQFFSDRVCDGISRRKGRNASEVFSAYYEQ
jgi:NCS2 family nucleobase:cation symporter-2